MRILIVSQYFYPENFRINDLVDKLISLGHEVTVLTGLPNYPKGKFFNGFNYLSCGLQKKGNLKLIRVPIIPRFSSSKVQLVFNYLSFAFSSIMMSFFYCREKYDVIFTYAPSPPTVAFPSIILSFFKQIPHVIWVQDLWPEVFMAEDTPKKGLFYKLIKSMMQVIYRSSDKILIPAREFKPYILELGIKEEKIYYFPNWAEKFFSPIPKEEALNRGINLPGGDTFKLMFAGNIGLAQSFDVIIEAAKQLKNEKISWIILGDGRKKSWLDKEIKKYSLEDIVFTLGQKPVEEMPFYFAMSDALLVSLRSHPVFSAWIPGKIQSYLACGKPIIGLISGAGARVINDSGSGFSVNSDDFNELAEKINLLINSSSEEREKIGSNALEYYNREFNRDKLVKELENIFLKLQ